MSNPYKAHKALPSGATPYFTAWQTLSLPVFTIIILSVQKYVNHIPHIFLEFPLVEAAITHVLTFKK